ncbi:MAG: hypothetical protein HFF93_04945 [Oscillibacter sp.]|nr:hypothetical protein [Oscillibacter sp.]
MLYQINQLEVLFPSLKLGNNTFDLSRFAVAAVNTGNRKTWHILLPTFQFGSNKYEKLGFGLMRLPQLDPANAAPVDVEQVKQVVERFLEKGFAYFDTAWMYAGFTSENVAKEALVDRYPRDSFTLAAKLHAGLPDCFICISLFLFVLDFGYTLKRSAAGFRLFLRIGQRAKRRPGGNFSGFSLTKPPECGILQEEETILPRAPRPWRNRE